MTKIKRCKCEHKFQDKQYGKHRRVHNYAEKVRGGNGGWRCTVCGSVKA
jgi:hypothetical protein